MGELRRREALVESAASCEASIADGLAADGLGLVFYGPVLSTDPELQLEIEHLRALVTFLENEFRAAKAKLETLLSSNSITFDLLWLLFADLREVTFVDIPSGLRCAGKV